MNQDFLSFIGGTRVAIEELARRIIAASPSIEGVTYSGGEPFTQPAALAELTSRVREHGLSVVCYTGFTLAELRSSPLASVHALLGQVDILIDGPYVEEQAGPFLWRGSANQGVHVLSDRYPRSRSFDVGEMTNLEINVDSAGCTQVGSWPAELRDRLARRLGGAR